MLMNANSLRQILRFLLDNIGAVFYIVWNEAGLLGVGLICIPLIGRVFNIIKKIIS